MGLCTGPPEGAPGAAAEAAGDGATAAACAAAAGLAAARNARKRQSDIASATANLLRLRRAAPAPRALPATSVTARLGVADELRADRMRGRCWCIDSPLGRPRRASSPRRGLGAARMT